MQRLVYEIAEATTVVAHLENFPSVTTVRALRECDVIVSCVDRLQVRDDLNRLSKRYLIPLIDVGLERERGGRPPGYAGDPRLPDPAVVTLNDTVASIAATEVL